MVFTGFTMLISSIKCIIELKEIVVSYIVLIICAINIIIKFLLYLYSKSNFKKTSSIIIKAMMIDHRNDCIITLFTVLSIMISYFGFYYMDGICGIILSFLLLISGIKVFANACNLLLDLALDEDSVYKLKKYIEKFDCNFKVEKILSRNIGEKYLVVVKVIINENFGLQDICNKINDIKQKALNEFCTVKDIIISVDYYQLNNIKLVTSKYN